MRETILELIKKFEEDSEIVVSATEALTCCIVYGRVFRSPANGTSQLHHGIQHMAGSNEDGTVLVLREPVISDTCSVEFRGPWKQSTIS